ncbi:MAG: FtsH protease activity modulator HflK [Deltaproteobacteria bacterium]|nr:FtsH protease activity modulator HflK [Deltaproteobacteria bacterium]
MTDRRGKSIDEVFEDLNRILNKIGRGRRKEGEPIPMKPNWSTKLQWLIIVGILAAIGLFTSYYQIETAQQGVVTRFGAFDHIADEGPHFKLPFGIDQVYKIEVTRIHELQFGFRKSSNLSEELARLESLMLTGDLNVAVVEWILQYRITDPRKYLFNAANVEKNIRDVSISVMRRVVGDKLVSDVLTTDRVVIAQTAQKLTQEVLDSYNMGILLNKIHLQNVTPPEVVKPAFNEINIAKQEQEQLINQAKGTYNKFIPEAEGKAAKLLSEAEAYAVDTVNRAKGDSAKFVALLNAYKTAPEITKKRLFLDAMIEIFSNVSKITVVDEKVQGLLPIFGSMGGGTKRESSPEQEAEKTTVENRHSI